jgi:hypothetical protein
LVPLDLELSRYGGFALFSFAQRGRTTRGPPTALLKNGPVIGDGSQSREETLGKVGRFAAALCVVIHTRTGDFFEMRLVERGQRTDWRRGDAAAILAKPFQLARQ